MERGGEIAGRHTLQQAIVLLPLVLLPGVAGVAGPVFSFGALFAGALYAGFALRFARRQSMTTARGLLLASLVYIPFVYSLALFDPIVQLAIRN